MRADSHTDRRTDIVIAILRTYTEVGVKKMCHGNDRGIVEHTLAQSVTREIFTSKILPGLITCLERRV